MSVTAQTYDELRIRSGGACECGCGVSMGKNEPHAEGYGMEVHHRYFRSQYRGVDRDELRNLSLLYGPCHRALHNGDRELDFKLKQIANSEKQEEERAKEKVKRNKGNYYFGDKEKARQYRKEQYRKNKLYLKNRANAKDTSETSFC